MSIITPIILAGGKGSRLAPVLKDLPKPLAPVLGRPFITYQLDLIIAAGFNHVVIATGYLGDMFSDILGSSYHLLKITYSQEMSPLGTGGAIRKALKYTQISERLLVINGDSFLNLDLIEFISWATTFPEGMVLTFVEDCSRYGSVITDCNSRVIAFEEKRACIKRGWINAGIYLLSRGRIFNLEENEFISLEYDCLPAISARGELFGLKKKTDFIDIGLPETYKQACDRNHWIHRLN